MSEELWFESALDALLDEELTPSQKDALKQKQADLEGTLDVNEEEEDEQRNF